MGRTYALWSSLDSKTVDPSLRVMRSAWRRPPAEVGGGLVDVGP